MTIPSPFDRLPSGGLAIAIIQPSAQSLTALEHTRPAGARLILPNQPVVQSLVVAFVMIQLISTTHILASVEKSAIRGICGTAVKSGCITRS